MASNEFSCALISVFDYNMKDQKFNDTCDLEKSIILDDSLMTLTQYSKTSIMVQGKE